MKSNKALPFWLWAIIGIVGIIFLSNKLFDEGKVPTLEKYMAETMPFTVEIIVPARSAEAGVSTSSITAFVAATDQERQRGLSGVKVLADDAGMLFIFSAPQVANFWMKDMNFPLDMIWIDENKVVTGVSSNISPETFPKTFSSSVPVSYVLEVNAGIAEKMGIKTGTSLNFNIF